MKHKIVNLVFLPISNPPIDEDDLIFGCDGKTVWVGYFRNGSFYNMENIRTNIKTWAEIPEPEDCLIDEE